MNRNAKNSNAAGTNAADADTLDTRRPTVVLGGAGKTGRRVAERLRRRGLPVRPASRSTFVPFDWDEPRTWPGALDGAAAAYLAFQPDLELPGADATVAAVARLAVELGVERVVLLSGRGERRAEVAEQAVLAAHPNAAVARCSWFMQNFSEGFFAEGVASGVISLPVPDDVPEPFVDLDDVADVVVAALTEPGHTRRVHELTSPAAHTFPEVAEVISAACGRQVSFVSVRPEAFIDGVVGAGMGRPTAQFLAELFRGLMDGRNAEPTTGVRDVLGRPPGTLEEYARRASASGVWARAA